MKSQVENILKLSFNYKWKIILQITTKKSVGHNIASIPRGVNKYFCAKSLALKPVVFKIIPESK